MPGGMPIVGMERCVLMSNKRFISLIIILAILLSSGLLIAKITAGNPMPIENVGQLAKLEDNVEAWGLGKRLTTYVSNDRPYGWYIDQANTGTHSQNNCGPASVTMAGLWANRNFSTSTKAIRRSFKPFGGWWYAKEINGALKKYKIDFAEVTIEDQNTLIEIIDSGSIAILNNNMGRIPFNADLAKRTQRFYTYSGGHYFILKGYAIVDGNLFFEVYDPNNWGMAYGDGQPMGQNRYYTADKLLPSVLNWWSKAVVINP